MQRNRLLHLFRSRNKHHSIWSYPIPRNPISFKHSLVFNFNVGIFSSSVHSPTLGPYHSPLHSRSVLHCHSLSYTPISDPKRVCSSCAHLAKHCQNLPYDMRSHPSHFNSCLFPAVLARIMAEWNDTRWREGVSVEWEKSSPKEY